MKDRRYHDRNNLKLEVELSYHGMQTPQRYYARDISLGGIFLETGEHANAPLGAEVDLILRHPGDGLQAHSLKGRIARADQKGIGLIFHNLELEYFSFLERLLRPGVPEEA